MENIKIWTLDGLTATPLDAIGEVESEWGLDDTLVNNPSLLLDGLTLVGRQIPTAGGWLDLLGVDANGRLCVFELKRGTVARDAVAQVVDYASDLDAMGWADLCSLISENSGSDGIEAIEDFENWYNRDYGELSGLKPLRLFLVGLGVDDRTERMANFLANSGVDISLLTFHGFAHEGKTLLAKQVELEGGVASERGRTARYSSREERWGELHRIADDYGVRELFDSVVTMFRETWDDWARETPNIGGSLRLELTTEETASGWGAYVRVDVYEEVRIVFYRRAFALATDDFRQATETIDYSTFPHNLEPLEETNQEIQFPLTAADWERHKGDMTALAQAVYDAWMENGDDEEDETDSEE